jgi:phosphoribosylformylglycinamidine cyclo-ligase
MKKQKMTYSQTGVNYSAMDPVKLLAQMRAKSTANNLNRFGMTEVGESRGESAYVWEEKDSYRAFVIEGLGTKNIVADETRKITGKTHYDAIAQDAVAMIVNDLIVVGADPQVVNAYFAVGNSEWFSDEERSRDLVEGWANACDISGAVWGGGESPTLKGIVNPETIDLGGSAIGTINPKSRLILGNKLGEGDSIILIESNGIHSNGLTLARTIASQLPQGYATKLSDGKGYGESLLTPTHIYSALVRELFKEKIDIHYMVNITGHGWRKLMRAKKDLSYVINQIPSPQPLFEFLQEYSENDDEEMYGNFNMGAGFAIFVDAKDAEKTLKISKRNKLNAINAGTVEKGERQVVIEPLNIVFKGESLKVRA